MIKYFTLFIAMMLFLSCSQPDLVLDNEFDPENPDFIAPETNILYTVPLVEEGVIEENEITITWQGNDENMEFQYKHDDESWSAWSLTPTKRLEYLDDRVHTFLVRGRYPSGTEEEYPDTLNFEVDAIKGTSLRIDRLFTNVINQSTFSVDIKAEEAQNLAGCGIQLEFNADALELQEIIIGEFFEQVNGADVLFFDTLLTSAGIATFNLDIAMYGGSPNYVPGTATGTIASLMFLAKTTGEYNLLFTDETTLRNELNEIIEINTMASGLVNIE